MFVDVLACAEALSIGDIQRAVQRLPGGAKPTSLVARGSAGWDCRRPARHHDRLDMSELDTSPARRMGPEGSATWNLMLDGAEAILREEGYAELTSRRVA